MLVGVMVTDGGPHPPEKWAAITASQIVDIASGASREATMLNTGDAITLDEARAFEQRVLNTLTAHHELVQSASRTALEAAGPEGLAMAMNHHDFVDDCLDDILNLANATDDNGRERWPAIRKHLMKPETRDYLRRLLVEHFHSNMMVERSYHADRNADHPHAQAFHAAMRGEVLSEEKAPRAVQAMLNPHFRSEE